MTKQSPENKDCFAEFILRRPERGTLSIEAETGDSWIPGLARLARNDGHVVFVIPAQAGIQGVWYRLGILFLNGSIEGYTMTLLLILNVISGMSYKGGGDCEGERRCSSSHFGHLVLFLGLGLAQHLDHEGQQSFERLKVGGLKRHQVFNPPLPLSQFDLRVGMNLHDERALRGERGLLL